MTKKKRKIDQISADLPSSSSSSSSSSTSSSANTEAGFFTPQRATRSSTAQATKGPVRKRILPSLYSANRIQPNHAFRSLVFQPPALPMNPLPNMQNTVSGSSSSTPNLFPQINLPQNQLSQFMPSSGSSSSIPPVVTRPVRSAHHARIEELNTPMDTDNVQVNTDSLPRPRF